jgi:hypothetical protein
MAITRSSTASDGSDSSSSSVTLSGNVLVGWVVYSNGQTLSTATFGGNSATIQNTQNLVSEGYKISMFTYTGGFSGSNSVAYTWTGGTPGFIRSVFAGYAGANAVEAASGNYGTTGTISITSTKDKSWIVGMAISATANSSFAGSTNQNGAIYDGNSGITQVVAGDSGGVITPAGATSQSYVISGYNTAITAIFVNPAPETKGASLLALM